MSVAHVSALSPIAADSIVLHRDVEKGEVIQSKSGSVEVFGHVGEGAFILAYFSISWKGEK